MGVPLEEMDGGADELVEGGGVVVAIAAAVGIEGGAQGGEAGALGGGSRAKLARTVAITIVFIL